MLITFRVSTNCPLSHCPKDISSRQDAPNHTKSPIGAAFFRKWPDKHATQRLAPARCTPSISSQTWHTLQIAMQLHLSFYVAWIAIDSHNNQPVTKTGFANLTMFRLSTMDQSVQGVRINQSTRHISCTCLATTSNVRNCPVQLCFFKYNGYVD